MKRLRKKSDIITSPTMAMNFPFLISFTIPWIQLATTRLCWALASKKPKIWPSIYAGVRFVQVNLLLVCTQSLIVTERIVGCLFCSHP